jgi:hypothetical protein
VGIYRESVVLASRELLDYLGRVANDSNSYRVAEGVLFQELDRESVLLNLRTELYYALDPVGTRIWKLLVETRSVDMTVGRIRAEYDVEESGLRLDVETLVRKLVAKGLLIEEARVVDGAAA